MEPDPEALVQARLSVRAHESALRALRAAEAAQGQALRHARTTGWSMAAIAQACGLTAAAVDAVLQDS